MGHEVADSAMPAPETPVAIDILAMPEASASVLYGMFDLFKSAGRDWAMLVDGTLGGALIAPRVVSVDGLPMAAGNGVMVSPDARLGDGPVPAVVCVPEVMVMPGDPLGERFARPAAWLRECHDAGAIIASACSGALLLGEAGLLDGVDATTHWAYCDMLAARYPQTRVRPQQTLVVSGQGQRLVMAGGGSSWMDLALYLIARLFSVEEAMQVARVNLVDWHEVGQLPFARLACSRQTDDAVIAECQVWLADHYRVASPVAAMVARAGMPERSFKRRFARATGMSPLDYVHTLRLEEAKQMLEASALPVEAVANEVGYEDASFFSRLFRRRVGLTPAQYRRRFGGLRHALGRAQGVAAAQRA